MSEVQLALVAVEPGQPAELVDGDVIEGIAEASVEVSVLSPPPPELEERNLFAEAQRIAVRAASASPDGSTGRSSAPSATGSPASSADRRSLAIWMWT